MYVHSLRKLEDSFRFEKEVKVMVLRFYHIWRFREQEKWGKVLMAKFPYCDSRHQQRNLDQRVTVNPPSSCTKDARMGCPNIPSDD